MTTPAKNYSPAIATVLIQYVGKPAGKYRCVCPVCDSDTLSIEVRDDGQIAAQCWSIAAGAACVAWIYLSEDELRVIETFEG